MIDPASELAHQRLLELLSPPRWTADALCREHPGVNFFPQRGESHAPAVAVCARCLVRHECLEFAIEHRLGQGIWGGLGERQRRRLRRGQTSPTRPDLAALAALRARIQQLAATGHSVTEIARAVDRSRPAVIAHLRASARTPEPGDHPA